ncbi:MAG: Ribosomal RNA small subunit methyltransferase A [Parcubacteria group bacterium GW2011_GWC2_39_14]|nr:MAG: Ribosomal RNA small subunit methyltransferase A [Parcubacteria group bacterium GW2011_GWC2_39_14]KKR54903.1 MAG: Ribosomal RNA small subunit methyltransferase A [Parcubacteria group bacterium GW2011_GWA2_40_23]
MNERNNEKKKTGKPKKYLGQNFLVDKNILQKIIQVADIKKSDMILEVGPGRGVLTAELCGRAQCVLAVEKDKDLIQSLEDQKLPKLQILAADIMKVDDRTIRAAFKGKSYRVIANLPYNITSQFLKVFLEREYAPSEMLLMLQKEVAERICRKNGENSVLSLAVQFFAEPKIRFLVKKNSFFPRPKVESAIIEIKNIRKDKFKVEAEKFFEVVKLGFGQKRKQLKNNLKKFGEEVVQKVLIEMGYKSNARAEELSLVDWVNLVQRLNDN